MTQRLNDFFARYADPQYDIWKGGKSKAKRLVETPLESPAPQVK